MTGWSAVTWTVARAGGLTAYALLTAAVVVGLALSLRWQTPRWPRLLNTELHNFLTLLGLVFVVIHVLAVWLDPFTHFAWYEIFIPFTSSYRSFWMGLGIVALYLALALAASVWLRPRIGYTAWRRLHTLTLAVYALTTVHGIVTGSDSGTAWAFALYCGSVALVGYLLWRRLNEPVGANQARHPALALGLLVGLVALAIWAALTSLSL